MTVVFLPFLYMFIIPSNILIIVNASVCARVPYSEGTL